MGPGEYYISDLEGGAVANGDILNLSIDLLDDYWVRDVGAAPEACFVGTVIAIDAPGSAGGVYVRVDGYPGAILVPLGHPALAHHVRPAALGVSLPVSSVLS